MAEEELDPVDQTPAADTAKLPATPPVDKSQYVVVADDAVLAASTSSRKPRPAKGPLKPESLSADYIVVAGDKKAESTSEQPTTTMVTPTAATPTVAVPTAAAPAAAAAAPAVAVPTTATEVIGERSTEAPLGDAGTPRVVYIAAPVPPKPHGNRGFGVLIAIGASVIFAVLFAFAVLLVQRSILGFATMTMLANYGYWIPVGVFVVGMLLTVLIINRGGWWTYIIGSAIVAVLVYAGSTALITIVSLYVLGQSAGFVEALASPTAIAAGILAREVALWSGVITSHRGKRVRIRNTEERAAFDREQAANVS